MNEEEEEYRLSNRLNVCANDGSLRMFDSLEGFPRKKRWRLRIIQDVAWQVLGSQKDDAVVKKRLDKLQMQFDRVAYDK